MQSPVIVERLQKEEQRVGLEVKNVRAMLKIAVETVADELGTGRRESVYQCALKHEIQKRMQQVALLEFPIPILYKGERVGVSYIDLLVTNSFFVEAKATAKIGGKDVLQACAYARDSGLLGALVNFKQTAKGGVEIVYVNGQRAIEF